MLLHLILPIPSFAYNTNGKRMLPGVPDSHEPRHGTKPYDFVAHMKAAEEHRSAASAISTNPGIARAPMNQRSDEHGGPETHAPRHVTEPYEFVAQMSKTEEHCPAADCLGSRLPGQGIPIGDP